MQVLKIRRPTFFDREELTTALSADDALNEGLEELHALVGVETVKGDVGRLINFQRAHVGVSLASNDVESSSVPQDLASTIS